MFVRRLLFTLVTVIATMSLNGAVQAQTTNFEVDKSHWKATREDGSQVEMNRTANGMAFKSNRRKAGGFHLAKGASGEWLVRDNAGNVTGRIERGPNGSTFVNSKKGGVTLPNGLVQELIRDDAEAVRLFEWLNNH